MGTFLKFMGAIIGMMILIDLLLYYTDEVGNAGEQARKIWSKVRPNQRIKIIIITDIVFLIVAVIIYFTL